MFLTKKKAFTILEMLMVMVLTTLFSMLAFYGYQLVHKQFIVYQSRVEVFDEYLRFSALIQQDFNNAKIIEASNKRIYLTPKIIYEFNDSLIIRISSKPILYADTFFIKAAIASFSFESKHIDQGIIDKCKVSILGFNQTQYLLLNKRYSAYDLINYQNNHGN